MPFQVTDAGISVQTLEEIRSELKAAYTDPNTGLDPDLDVSDDSLFGRLIGIHSEREYALQQQILAVYNDTTVGATGVGLTRLALVTGTVRNEATFSTATVQLSLNAGVTVPAGRRVSDASGNVMFEILGDVTNPGGSPAVIAGVARSLEPGPVLAPPNTLTTIVPGDAVIGWTGVTNAVAATTGSMDETDPDLRLRRNEELNSSSSANLDAIVTAVQAVPDVGAVRGYHNTTNSTNADGLPAHSFEIVVSGTPDEDAVAEAIWSRAPAGIAAVHGTLGTIQTGQAVDMFGDAHDVVYTIAEQVEVYVRVDVEVDPDLYPADGDAQIVANITAAIQDQADAIGSDVIATKLFAQVYKVPGVVDVTLLALDDAPAPTLQQNVVVGSRGYPVVADVTVNS